MKLISQATSLGYLEPIRLDDLDVAWHKNVSFKMVEDYPLKEQVKYLASLLPKPARFFDLKIQKLEQGQLPCLPGWHLDTGPDKEVNYVLMTAGVSKTEFALMELDVPYSKNMKIFCHRINSLVSQPTKKLNDFEIISYNNTTIHRGTPAIHSGSRLLIRVMG